MGAAAKSNEAYKPTEPHVSNPISGEVGAAAQVVEAKGLDLDIVSDPISGEVGAAAPFWVFFGGIIWEFQTPSAGRWVLQQDECSLHDDYP